MTVTASTWIEIERPKGWRGEHFEPCQFDDHELDLFEVQVEGSVTIWVDPHYGADADGNRGIELSGQEVEDLEFTIIGDFRPFYLKVRDIFYVSWKNVLFTYNNLQRCGFRERGLKGWWKIHRKNLMKWTQFSDHYSLPLEAKRLSESEIDEAEEKLIRDAEEYDNDLRDFDEDAYYERKMEQR
jgi:hypothetical protein